MSRSAAFCVCLLLLAACGGGGGGGASGGLPAAPAPAPSPAASPFAQVLGSRAVPGYTLAVTQLGPARGGQGLTVTVAVANDPDQAPPVQVEAALAVAEPEAWTSGTPGDAGTWSWIVTLPADPTGLRAWVRVTDAEGNVSQSGAQDFALGR